MELKFCSFYIGYSRDHDVDQKNDTKAPETSDRPVKRARRARHEVYVPSILGPSTLEATSFSESLSSGIDGHHQSSRNSSSHGSSAHNSSAVENSNVKVAGGSAGSNAGQSSFSDVGGNVGKSGSSYTDEKSGGNSGSLGVSAGSSSATNTPKKQSQNKKDTQEKKYKKRKKQSDNSPPNIPIDPDEPTYCLCDQVSRLLIVKI